VKTDESGNDVTCGQLESVELTVSEVVVNACIVASTDIVVLVVRTGESGNDVNCGVVERVVRTVAIGKSVVFSIVDDDVVVSAALVSEVVVVDSTVV